MNQSTKPSQSVDQDQIDLHHESTVRNMTDVDKEVSSYRKAKNDVAGSDSSEHTWKLDDGFD